MARPRASTSISLSNNPVQTLPPKSSEPLLTAHQQLTVWDSWDRSKVQLIIARLAIYLSWIVRLEATNNVVCALRCNALVIKNLKTLFKTVITNIAGFYFVLYKNNSVFKQD